MTSSPTTTSPHWASSSRNSTRAPWSTHREQVFAALEHTAYEDVKVLLLGQDPYHGAEQAHGLCFSVQRDVPIPPSLLNVFKELSADLGHPIASHGCLTSWAEQGVLLLNAVLTVREAEPASHEGQGWERLTDAIIERVSARADPVVFILWGRFARSKKRLIDTQRHYVVESGHPSPLSIRYFRDSKPFSKVNAKLEEWGKQPMDWQIPD